LVNMMFIQFTNYYSLLLLNRMLQERFRRLLMAGPPTPQSRDSSE
jgi:hypothetical protein